MFTSKENLKEKNTTLPLLCDYFNRLLVILFDQKLELCMCTSRIMCLKVNENVLEIPKVSPKTVGVLWDYYAVDKVSSMSHWQRSTFEIIYAVSCVYRRINNVVRNELSSTFFSLCFDVKKTPMYHFK